MLLEYAWHLLLLVYPCLLYVGLISPLVSASSCNKETPSEVDLLHYTLSLSEMIVCKLYDEEKVSKALPTF